MSSENNTAATIALPVVLRARIPLGLLLLYLALISVGVAMSAKERYMEVALIAVIAGMIGLLQHFPGLSTLTLDDKGFTVKTIFGSRSLAWREASNFHPIRKRRVDFVTWDYADNATRPPRSLSQILSHWKTYDAPTLATLMNRIRQQTVDSCDQAESRRG
ncbi:MAG TPA: hypothetical protein VM571_06010 [Noviherbaspirillum sp.]|nr:hypothetical protein [Noviherbaspirillum sp.]